LPDFRGHTDKDSLNRQQFGGNVGFAERQDVSFIVEGLRSDARFVLHEQQYSRPRIRNRPLSPVWRHNLSNIVPCITTDTSNNLLRWCVPAPICAFAPEHLDDNQIRPGFVPPPPIFARRVLTLIGESVRANGGLFVPDPFEHFSACLDHRFSDSNQGPRHSFAHLTEKDPTCRQLTPFSRGTELAWDALQRGSGPSIQTPMQTKRASNGTFINLT
jgi:hypothetical protein